MAAGKKHSFQGGSLVAWRGHDWLVKDVNDETLHLIPLKPEVRSAIADLYVRLESVVKKSDFEPINHEAQLAIPPFLCPEAWKPHWSAGAILNAVRFQSSSVEKLLWSSSVPLHRMDRQLVPLHYALNSDQINMMIADDVGLGKTTEAAIIIAELLARRRIKRVLVIAPSHLVKRKWAPELNQRFGLCFQQIDSDSFENIKKNLALSFDQNPLSSVDRCVVSLDWAKEGYVKNFLTDKECPWDLVIIDECHRVAKRSKSDRASSLRYKLASEIAKNSNGLILMSATPHDGSNYSFKSLVELLQSGDKKPTMIRRLRRDIPDEDYKPGSTTFFAFNLGDEWKDIGERLSEFCKELKSEKAKASQLLEITLFKRFLSSPQALACTLGLEEGDSDKEYDPESDEIDNRANAFLRELKDSSNFKGIIGGIEKPLRAMLKKPELDKKLQLLIEQIEARKDCILINSEFVDTLEYLFDHLKKKFPKRKILIAHGQLPGGEDEIEKAIKEFKSGAILLASDVLSEGVDLQEHCHILVHYDLPFRPYRIEQRNGRIDRMGQKTNPEFLMLVPNEKDLSKVTNLVGKKALGLQRLYGLIENQRKQLKSLVPILESESSPLNASAGNFYEDLEAMPKKFEESLNGEADNDKGDPQLVNIIEDQMPEKLSWSGQMGLGLEVDILPWAEKVLGKSLVEGLYKGQASLRNGELVGEGADDLVHTIYPGVSVNKDYEAYRLEANKDFAFRGDSHEECLTWGHDVWESLEFALSLWKSYELGDKASFSNLAALKSGVVDSRVYLSFWKQDELAVIRSNEHGGQLRSDKALRDFEAVFASAYEKHEVPSAKDLKDITEAAKTIYLKNLVELEKSGPIEFVGMIVLDPK